MKKKLLFIMPSLDAGGGEKSLVNLLSQIDYHTYEVDLFLFNHDGIFMDYIPEQVNILPLSKIYKDFSLPLYTSMGKLLKQTKTSILYSRLMFSITNRFKQNTSIKEQHAWKYLASSLCELDKQYDVAIGFLEKTSTYYCVDKVKADKKVGWIHIDYDELGMDSKFDEPYFKKLDKIVTVSKECADVLKRTFPDMQEKIEIMYNIVSPLLINKMAEELIIKENQNDADEINILSIGRLHYQKGFEIAVEACKKLVDKGYKINWNIIGEGEERRKLTALIKKYRLENNFNLLGLKPNPYPYIKEADVYVQSSRFEGKSIAIDEAKILQKPIVVTNFSTAADQIKNGIDGLIVEMNAESLANGIETMLNEVELRKSFIENLANEELGTEEEINKLYSWI